MKRIFALFINALLLAGLIGVQHSAAQPVESAANAVSIIPGPPLSILNEIKLRKAISYCTDKSALVLSVYPLLSPTQVASLVRDSFLPDTHWAYHTPATLYLYNPASGKTLLDELGWLEPAPGAIRKNAAEQELQLKFTTTNAAFRQTWAAVFETQMAGCGIRIVRSHVPSAWLFGQTTGLVRRDFEIGAYAWVNPIEPGDFVHSLYACDMIPTPKNSWVGQNYPGWCNTTASDAIDQATSTFVRAQQTAALVTVQDEFGKDVPTLPLFDRMKLFAYNNNLTGFSPSEGDDIYAAKAYQWASSGHDVIKWGMSGEPSTLFGLKQDWFGTFILSATGVPYTTPNYDPQTLLQFSFSTIGDGATNNTVSVNAGEKVVNADGNVVTLAAGVKVRDASGAVVTYSSGTVNMKQLDVTYYFLTGLEWNDGTAVSQADFQLGYDISCNPATGAADYGMCNRVKTFTTNTRGYQVTWLPGYRNPLFALAPFTYFPAHRPIVGGVHNGKTLSQVPAADWASLPEVSRIPWSAGPYYVSNWVGGSYIELSANPHSVLGAPATATIRVVFSDNPEGDLIADSLDIVGYENLPNGLTSALNDASTLTKVVVPTGTWEHLDFNFNYFPKIFLPVTLK